MAHEANESAFSRKCSETGADVPIMLAPRRDRSNEPGAEVSKTRFRGKRHDSEPEAPARQPVRRCVRIAPRSCFDTGDRKPRIVARLSLSSPALRAQILGNPLRSLKERDFKSRAPGSYSGAIPQARCRPTSSLCSAGCADRGRRRGSAPASTRRVPWSSSGRSRGLRCPPPWPVESPSRGGGRRVQIGRAHV